MRRSFWILLLLPVLCVQAQAQPSSQSFGIAEDRQTNVPSYYFHVLPGEATIQVYVWGTVGAPGAYTVAVIRQTLFGRRHATRTRAYSCEAASRDLSGRNLRGNLPVPFVCVLQGAPQ